jgi:hypothetical protein
MLPLLLKSLQGHHCVWYLDGKKLGIWRYVTVEVEEEYDGGDKNITGVTEASNMM